MAISADGRWWFLLNVSADVRQQVLSFASLGPPAESTRGTSIAGCILSDAEADHTSGLLQLREGCTFAIYSTSVVRAWLNSHFPIEPIISSFSDRPWHVFGMDAPFELLLPDGGRSGLVCRAFETGRCAPRYVPGEVPDSGSMVGLLITDTRTGRKIAYAPCVTWMDDAWKNLVESVDCLLFDGTFWSDDEPRRWEISQRTAREMGHLPVGGAGGSLAWLARLAVRDRVYVHINNTNPMLDRRSPEFAMATGCGVKVAEDGDEFQA